MYINTHTVCLQYLYVFMFSHSQYAGTCIHLCILPHSPLTLSITLPSHTHIMLIMIIMMHVHTHTHTNARTHTHAHTHNSYDQYNFYRVSDYHSTSAKNEQLWWWVVNGTCVHNFTSDSAVSLFLFRVVNRPSMLFTYMTPVDISTPLRLLSIIYCQWCLTPHHCYRHTKANGRRTNILVLATSSAGESGYSGRDKINKRLNEPGR